MMGLLLSSVRANLQAEVEEVEEGSHFTAEVVTLVMEEVVSSQTDLLFVMAILV